MSCIEVNVVRLLQCRLFILMSSSCSLISEPFYSFSLFVAYCCLLVLVSLSPPYVVIPLFLLWCRLFFGVVQSFYCRFLLCVVNFYCFLCSCFPFSSSLFFFSFSFYFTARFHFPMPNSEGKLTPPKQQSKPKQILVFVGHKFNNNLSKKKKIKNKNYWFIVFWLTIILRGKKYISENPIQIVICSTKIIKL